MKSCLFVLIWLVLGINMYSQSIMPVYSASFENNSTSADVDKAYMDIENGSIYVTENPSKNDVNSSNYVLVVRTTPTNSPNHTRAEYRNASRMPTEGKVHIFQWMIYFPEGYLDDVDIRSGWNAIAQFWAEPCAKYSRSTDSYYDIFNTNICYSGGIFNSITIGEDNNSEYVFKFRAEPDCRKVHFEYPEGEWFKITLEIYWTVEYDGYFNIYINNELFAADMGIRTLPDGWVDGECDLRWKVGLYDAWSSSTKDYVYYYLDNLNWYVGEDIEDVCPLCVGSIDCSDFDISGVKSDSDYGLNNGSIDITVSGGSEPYNYLWSDGSANEDRSGLSSGSYTVVVTDANSCEISATYTVNELTSSLDLTPVYAAAFEGNTTSADIDKAYMDIENGSINVVSNPDKDDVNSSNYVLRMQTTPSSSPNHTRAEYRNSTRMPTEGKEHIFQWMVYFPDDYMEDIDVRGDWSIITQFWSEPCSKYTNSTDSYYDIFNNNICYSGGIFNEVRINGDNSSQYMFQFRAQPDCNSVNWSYPKGEWVKITLQIYWSQSSDGYYNIYIDNELLESVSDVRTLPDGWVEGECDLRWKVGLYDAWSSSTKDNVYYYVDDLKWYINGDIQSVCPQCVGDCSGFKVEGIITDSNFGESNGSIAVTASGGSLPYSYSWSDGLTIEDRSGLSAGEYVLTVSDQNNCSASETFLVNELSDPCTGFTVSGAVVNSDYGASTGTITLSVAGGTAPYSYLWSDGVTTPDRSGLSSGIYSLTTTDANECTNEVSFEVLENANPCSGFTVSGAVVNSDYDASTGAITLSVVGGTAPYSYLWSDGVTTQNRSGLNSGTYSLTTTDANECTNEVSFEVLENADPCVDFNVDARVIASDFDEDNGSITLNVTGGEAPFDYLWSDGEITNNRSRLSTGTYTVTITDNNNCVLTETYTIEVKNPKFELIRFYPNPTTGLLAVEFSDANNESVSVTVLDESGNVVITKNVNAVIGKNKISISLSVDDDGNKLESGPYEIELNNGESIIKFEIVKQK